MARDLIPPPSPAGRPAPDPEPHEDPVADATRATEPQREDDGGGGSGPSPFRGRFGFMAGVLLGCAVAAAIVAATLVTTNHGPEEGLAKNWSPWHPKSDDPLGGAEEIAAHIQRQYRSDGRKRGSLVSVQSGPIVYNGLALSVAVRPASGDVQILEGLGIQYTLNGLGEGGVIKDGKPSRARNRLLRREALELALYSFRYLPDVSMVVALMPPRKKAEDKKAEDKKAAAKAAKAAKGKAKATPTPKATPSAVDPAGKGLVHQAIFYRPADLRPQLEVPLVNTLDLKTPRVRGLDGDGEEARRVDSLTRSNVFAINYTMAQDARPYLVLDRP